jgi:hypothetical protein
MAELFDILTYDSAKASAVEVTAIQPAYQNIVTLNVPNREAGQYVMGMSMTYVFDTTARSAYMRWRVDGGDWQDRISEPNDASDISTHYYEYPETYPAGPHVIELEMAKEDGIGTLTVSYADLFFQRVG